MVKPLPKQQQAFLQLSVEEENLASIPFAVLESRVGKRISKLELLGTKVLPDGQELRVSRQIQGNTELGLPTEQDLDIFVALGVITFRDNFSKTVTFTGREIAKILGISSVHGKFYQRLKLAMDRFVPLRFRALTETDRQEEVKWINVFQEASFTLDRTTGRCVGTVTWTDKLIQSMNSGFFRVLDAGRYMELDGITVKHLYRFLAVAFEKNDIVIIDARRLATEHLGILNVPKYLSRLLQTLEPAFDQLVRIEVLGSYHVTNSENWEIALTRHTSYVPERKALLLREGQAISAGIRENVLHCLEDAGFDSDAVVAYADATTNTADLYQLERATRLLKGLLNTGILPHVGMSLIRRCLDEGVHTEAGREQLDWIEIALDTCRQKLESGQRLKNPAGIVMRIAKDAEARVRLVGESRSRGAQRIFRQRERQQLAEHHRTEQRQLVFEYEEVRLQDVRAIYDDMPEPARQALRAEKSDALRQQSRYEKMHPQNREEEIDALVLQDIADREFPPFEKWLLRKRAAQAILPFAEQADSGVPQAN